MGGGALGWVMGGLLVCVLGLGFLLTSVLVCVLGLGFLYTSVVRDVRVIWYLLVVRLKLFGLTVLPQCYCFFEDFGMFV